MIRVLLLALALVCSAPAPATRAEIVDAISERLTLHVSLEGRFRQEKNLSFLETPIASSGSFTLSAAHGLGWLVEEPLRSEMKVQDSQVLLDGKAISDRGVGQLMAKIMQAFLAGDLRPLTDSFSTSGELEAGKWHLRLEPKAVVLRSVLSHIDLRGDGFLEQIVIWEHSKTATLIEFSQIKAGKPNPQARDAPRR